ncbi:InlB B-repeat-containing protein [uncultured Treponema sp.]|uniref:InlB B-repeat-containing protein n=1 Tax=uncultured Treponema sp. TaxID=162155 RepID=UPI0025FF7B47|nr:InlB B-repeat-containing protein [uncultured Treponema sp.]
MKNKAIFLFTIIPLILFAGCSQITENSEESVAAPSDGVTLTVAINEKESRTALPSFQLSDLNYINLSYQDKDEDGGELSWLTTLGSWESAEEMAKAAISFKTGTYAFTLTATSDDIVFSETKSVTIQNGANALKFTPKMSEFDNTEPYGKGNLSVAIRYDNSGIASVTGCLYTIEGYRVPGYAEEELTIGTGGNSSYVKNNVPSGNYILVFNFYADSAKTQLRGSYREYCAIVNEKTSSSECVLSNMGSLFTITYNLDGGAFDSGITAPGSYTRQCETITLPTNVTKSKCTFGGWYEKADFTGNAVTEIRSGSIGNKTFYARWLENATITFEPNATGAQIKTNTQTVVKGVESNLIYASDLELKNSKGSFLGWATKADATKVEYSDGGAITVNDRILKLFAIWSVSSINPQSAGDTTDTDGDGLTDWDEIHKYYTDPSNKDTDGDGWDDGTEVKGLYNANSNTFNPLIADTPQLEIRMTGKPGISYKYQVTTTTSDTVSVSENDGRTGSSSTTSSNTKTHSETSGWSTKAGFSVMHGFGTGTGYQNTLTISGEAGYSGSTTNGDSYTYSQSASEGWSKSWSNGQSSTKSNGRTVTGGSLAIPVRFKNPSNIAYTVEHVTVALYRLPTNSAETRSFVTNLTLPNDKAFTIKAESESGDFKLSADLSIAKTEELLKYSSGFEIEVSGYKITLQKEDSSANDFTEALTQVRSKTAAVYIDWGSTSGIKARTFNVSVKNQYNTSAQSIDELYETPTLDYIFQTVLHYTKGTDYTLNKNGCLQKFLTVENTGSYTEGAWFILHKFTKGSTRKQTLYAPYTEDVDDWSMDKIKVSAGDEISIFFSVDHDGDGVPLNEELIYGTSDDKTDYDGDGLSDFEEIYGWYKDGIGLESKYSNLNKVYSNPVLKDSDGDDLLDYDSASSKRDNDPVVPKMKNDTSLSVAKYALKNGGSLTDFNVSSNKTVYSTKTPCKESVCLDVQPKLAFATVKYSRTRGGPSYSDFDRSTEFELDVGENIIYIQCTAPDGTTKKEYEFHIESKFKDFSGSLNVVNKEYEGGRTYVSWNAYEDKRTKAEKAGGYILYGSKGSISSKELDKTHLAQATDSTANLDSKSEFYLKLDQDKINEGRLSLDLAARTEYTMFLFAYTRSNSYDSFKSVCLAQKTFTTKKKSTGTLHFWAHFVKDCEDCDGSCDPQYYWNWSSSEPMFSKINEINQGSKGPDFDVDDEQFYCFGEKTIHRNEPGKYGGCSKEYKGVYSLTKDHSFTLGFDAWEYDVGSGDDHLGTVTMYFNYSAKTNSWNVKWHNPGGSDESYSIPYSNSTDDHSWGIHDDDGYIQVHFGLKWWED